jgi:hypothetical protein
MEGSRVELKIEVDPGSEPITGSAKRFEAERAEPVEFVGWTGLMGAIDRLLGNSEEIKEDADVA